jgi:RNA polymerase sigma factor (sigma-70 family)
VADDLNQLILQCAQNERRSQEKLYKRLYPSMFLLCKRFFPGNHEAMEAVNDGMMKVFRNIAKYDPAGGEFFNWAYTIVRNAALDKIKGTRFPVTEEINNSAGDWVDHNKLLHSLDWKDAHKMLDLLSPATRIVCSLFYFEGFSVKEIADRLELSQGTVKWHLSEARKKLRQSAKVFFDYKS